MHNIQLSYFSLFMGLILTLVLMAGCSTNNLEPHTLQHGGLTTFTATDNSETSLIKIPGALHKFCAARESDSISTPENGVSLGVGEGVVQDSIGVTSGSGALSLGGRDPLVLIIREFMYRVCELSLNHDLDKKDTIALYKYFIEKLIVLAPLTKADGGASNSLAAPVMQSNDKGGTSNTSTSTDADTSDTKEDDSFSSFDIK